MRYIFSLFIIITLHNALLSQPGDRNIDLKQVDCKLIEYFTKQYIDSVRLSCGLTILGSDVILYKAAFNHANYLNKSKEISHYQKAKTKYAPADRVKFYGGNFPMTGENVVRSFIYENIIDARSKKLSIYRTYKEIARHLVTIWVKSPGHYANIITNGYNLTGMAITFNPKNNAVTGVQVFAKAPQKYTVIPDNKLFPYEGTGNN